MNSNFNKQTSEGVYTFSGDDVFEALKMWCDKNKGITLDKSSIKSFRSIHNEEDGFVVEMSFNHKERKED